MEAKSLGFPDYATKESLAQQGGYVLALKGPQRDEAWMVFLARAIKQVACQLSAS